MQHRRWRILLKNQQFQGCFCLNLSINFIFLMKWNVGVILLYPLRWTRLCLNKKRFNELCVGQSPTTISSSVRGVQGCATSQFLTYTCTSTHHKSTGIGCLSPGFVSTPSTSSVYQKWPQSTRISPLLQDIVFKLLTPNVIYTTSLSFFHTMHNC